MRVLHRDRQNLEIAIDSGMIKTIVLKFTKKKWIML